MTFIVAAAVIVIAVVFGLIYRADRKHNQAVRLHQSKSPETYRNNPSVGDYW
jgi:hypothetical protein